MNMPVEYRDGDALLAAGKSVSQTERVPTAAGGPAKGRLTPHPARDHKRGATLSGAPLLLTAEHRVDAKGQGAAVLRLYPGMTSVLDLAPYRTARRHEAFPAAKTIRSEGRSRVGGPNDKPLVLLSAFRTPKPSASDVKTDPPIFDADALRALISEVVREELDRVLQSEGDVGPALRDLVKQELRAALAKALS